MSKKTCSKASKFADKPGYICNPETGRWVKEDGEVGRKIQGLPLAKKGKAPQKKAVKKKIQQKSKKEDTYILYVLRWYDETTIAYIPTKHRDLIDENLSDYNLHVKDETDEEKQEAASSFLQTGILLLKGVVVYKETDIVSGEGEWGIKNLNKSLNVTSIMTYGIAL